MLNDSETIKSPGRKRVALFLDGTWNTVGDNTNVWRLKALCAERGADGTRQVAYYSTGLGTFVGEKLRGGMFGYGLDKAVIDAISGWSRPMSQATRSSSSASAAELTRHEASPGSSRNAACSSRALRSASDNSTTGTVRTRRSRPSGSSTLRARPALPAGRSRSAGCSTMRCARRSR